MKIVTSLSAIPHDQQPVALTIGNFDGLHLGHQALLARLQEKAKSIQGDSVALTFQEHPSAILCPEKPVLKLMTQAHKIKLLDELGINTLILLPFTHEFSQQSPEQFLNTLMAAQPFSHLILGHDAVIGKGRQGDPANVKALAKKLHFQVEYLTPTLFEEVPISSSQIRRHLQHGNLTAVEHLIGRKFSIYGTAIQAGAKNDLSFYLDVSGLCLPPPGNYNVEVLWDNVEAVGLASLRPVDQCPHLLKVQLTHSEESLIGRHIEAIFSQPPLN